MHLAMQFRQQSADVVCARPDVWDDYWIERQHKLDVPLNLRGWVSPKCFESISFI